ncbi:MAG: ferritin-like domain-containing protein [Sphingomonas sp.]|uniref:ferritin-like domain-containing protein n=1 Tax=Sphingomonas sp. TaxID=28214 RepID=UPI0017FCF29E|nr:ferritin-like domain-containing protein [Sphingomonas sp.]
MTEPSDSTLPARRQFLSQLGLAATGMTALAFLDAPASAAAIKKRALADGGSDLGILQGALALENEGIAAYRIAGGSGLLTPGTLKVALVFKGHHEAHRDSLAALISKMGGKPAEPKSDAEYVKNLDLGALKNEGDVVKLAAGLEQGAANAYVGQVAALKDKQIAVLFAQLSTDEAVHWAVLNGALGNSIPSTAYLFG